jgi:hypothetical protein
MNKLMNKLSLLASLGALLMPNLLSAQSPLDGTWKVDMSQVDWSKKPDVYLLQNGMYSCKTCTPAYTVKADGSDQAVTGHPYFDTVAIQVVSDHEIKETDKKGGKVVTTSTTTIASDGKTATFSFIDQSNTNGGPPVTGNGQSTLVMKGPAGSAAVSGSWRLTKLESLSDNAIVWSYKVSGGSLTMSAKTGQTYTAKLDGSEAPMQGDPGVTSVSVKMLGKNVLQETDKRNGKVVSVATTTLNPDGKTGKVSATDTLANRTMTYAIVKQ